MSVKMQKWPEPGPGDTIRYDVLVDGETIGHVERCQTESWRKSGRMRTSLQGRPTHWEAKLTGSHVKHLDLGDGRDGFLYDVQHDGVAGHRCSRFNTRRDAVQALVAADATEEVRNPWG
jgi:hypothetical protein